jgi:hypothetical protein
VAPENRDELLSASRPSRSRSLDASLNPAFDFLASLTMTILRIADWASAQPPSRITSTIVINHFSGRAASAAGSMPVRTATRQISRSTVPPG